MTWDYLLSQLHSIHSFQASDRPFVTASDDPSTTDEDETGNYAFTMLTPGTFTVREIAPPGYSQTYPASPIGGTGELTFATVIKEDDGGVGGLFGATFTVVSPDDKHVYVAGSQEDSVAVFSRDAATGLLSFVHALKDGNPGLDYMAGMRTVTVSPDSQYVYAAALNDYALNVFHRDANTGQLTLVEVQRDNVFDADGALFPYTLAISPYGDSLYAASYYNDAVRVFSRDKATGQLSYIQVLQIR